MTPQILEWDSGFLGSPVARVEDADLTPAELAPILDDLRDRGVRLVYWPSEREWPDDLLAALGGRLVDRKTTYVIDLAGTLPPHPQTAGAVEPYDPGMPEADLISLAIQSGEYSRFAIDPQFPAGKFPELYTLWIRRSLRREIAHEVLVVRSGNRVIGMATLGEKDGRGDIGLIAVDRSAQGRGHGKALVRAAQRWFLDHGYTCGQVITQGTNEPACRLYESCGYRVERVEHFHHFWL